MSKSMYWKPVPKDEPPARDLPFDLKARIARRLWGHDGSLNGDETRMDKTWRPYLEGLADAGVDGADDLMAAIQAHGAVIVWIDE